MKRFILMMAFIAFTVNIYAQFQIGHRSLTYTDPARSNRSVPVEVYYPSTVQGDNVAIATGTFPLIVFGHGFLMGYSNYAFWKDNLTPLGYIMVFPTTEGGSGPDHASFGADLAFLVNKLKDEGLNASSPFYQSVGSTSAIMGHSMGGGSSFLACQNNTVPTCMINFAAAETDPSAVTAAASVTIPALVIAGEDDCVAPPADNQLLMYNALASACKTYVVVKTGAHCYFADYSAICTTGESFCNPVPSIAREDQLATTLRYTRTFLNYYLKATGTWNAFLDSLSTDAANITYQVSCPQTTSVDEHPSGDQVVLYPNPAGSAVRIDWPAGFSGSYSLRLTDMTGRTLQQWVGTTLPQEYGRVLNMQSYSRGTYTLSLSTPDQRIYRSLLILQ